MKKNHKKMSKLESLLTRRPQFVQMILDELNIKELVVITRRKAISWRKKEEFAMKKGE